MLLGVRILNDDQAQVIVWKVKLHVFIKLDRAAVIKKAEPTWRQEYLIFGRPHPNEGDVVHWVQIPIGRHHNECLTRWKFYRARLKGVAVC